MRIGIVTIHYNYTNLGCTLQAYCLARHLKRYTDSVEVIDQRYPGKMMAIGAPYTPSALTQFRFIENNLPRSQTFLYGDHSVAESYMRKNYDFLVYGSDEIWKFRFDDQNRQQHVSLDTPVPNIFWPLGLEVPKVSYAACVGKSVAAALPPALKSRLRDSLLEFQKISVRDTRSATMVRELCGREADIVPDPVYLEDLSDECDPDLIMRKLRAAGYKPGLPIVGHYLHGQRLAPIPGAQLVDLKRCQLTPPEFWYVPKLLDLMITNTHHGALVALIHNTPCFVVRPSPPKVNDHVVRYGLPENFEGVEAFLEKWNFEVVGKIVEEERNRGIEWLKEAISEYASGKLANSPLVIVPGNTERQPYSFISFLEKEKKSSSFTAPDAAKKFSRLIELSRRPVIIGGCGRSGTSLLQAVLSCHPEVAALDGETRTLCPGGYMTNPDLSKPFRAEELLDILMHSDIPESCTRWAEKTPKNILFTGRILEYLGPDSRFIHIVRDGRDVVTSRRQAAPDKLHVFPMRWVEDVEAGMWFDDHPQVLVLRYEDLVSNYEESMRKLCKFLELEYTDRFMGYPETANLIPFRGMRSLMPRPVDTHSIGRWREPEYESLVSELLAEPRAVRLLEHYGYL